MPRIYLRMDTRVKANYSTKIVLENSNLWPMIDLERFKIENNSFKLASRGSDDREKTSSMV